MQNVSIIGIGRIPVGEHWDSSLRELAAAAAQEALQDAGVQNVDAIYIANAYGTSASSQSHLGSLIADFIGLRGVETFTIEAADASGGAALRAGYLAVASGMAQRVLVLGVEKLTDAIASARVQARNVSLDADHEAIHGATLPALAALLMRRYMYEYQVDLNAFEGFSLNAHANGKLNQYAMYRNTLRPGAFAKAPMVADPVNLFDMAPDADGAAAVILAPSEQAADMVPNPVHIIGSAVSTDTFMLQDREDLLYLQAAHDSALKAYRQAGITASDIDVFEVHDAFTILSTLSLEATGFAEKGQGWTLASEQGQPISLNGTIPISTFGGLKSR
ncbi:MAG: thiolase domain-containing protein, partial [Chloroflexi bacterium]